MGQFQGFADSHDDMNLTPADLAKIKARTLIVHGDRDEFFPVEIPVEMYRAIPGSQLWIVPERRPCPDLRPARARIPARHAGSSSPTRQPAR